VTAFKDGEYRADEIGDSVYFHSFESFSFHVKIPFMFGMIAGPAP
jgi:hypothetical protein